MLLTKVLFLFLVQVVFQLCSSNEIIFPLNGVREAELNKNYSLVCDWGGGPTIEWIDPEGKYIDILFNCQRTGRLNTVLFANAIVTCDFPTRRSILNIPLITKNHDGMKITCYTDAKEEVFQIKVSDKTDLKHYLMITSSKKEIYNGQDVEIKCSWNNETKDMKAKLTCGNETNTGNGSTSLKLTVTKEWNTKLCVCEGNYLGKHIYTHHQIFVYFPPEVSVSNVTVAAGSMAVLNCSVDSGHPGTYSHLEWRHYFNKILLETRPPSSLDGSLLIPNTTWQDAGTWVCFVTNGKYNRSDRGYITVTGPPILQASNANVKAISGTNKKLEVQIFPSYDNIHITWNHNGQKISKGTPGKFSSAWQQTIKGQEVYLSGLIASLSLNDIQEKDAGNYSVNVVTKDGISSYSFDMQISAKSGMTITIAFVICGSLILAFFFGLFGCLLCHAYRRRKYHHSAMIDASMSTPRTRIFSVPKADPMDPPPTSNFELDIYEEIDDWNGNGQLILNHVSLKICYASKICGSKLTDLKKIIQEKRRWLPKSSSDPLHLRSFRSQKEEKNPTV